MHRTVLDSHYRAACAAGGIGVWTWDVPSGALVYDAVALSIIGLPPDTISTREQFESLIHPQDRPRFQESLVRALDPDGSGDLWLEQRMIRPGNGVEFWITAKGKVSFSNGVPQQGVGIIRDVTERRRSEARFAGIVSIAADAIISINGEQHITLFNDGAERIFGYARAEVIDQPLTVLLPDRFAKGHGGHIDRFKTSAVSSRRMGERGEIFGRRKNGEDFPAEASISHLEIGGQSTFTVVLRDISERKRVEERLARSNAELETRVAERTHELNTEMQRREMTQAQLVRTQRMEAFGQLTGGVAHDFNNLLTVITGNLELLEMRLKEERERTLLKRAYDAAEMGARLTSRLLTFARRRQFETVQLNLNDCETSGW
jgi:PAS domain S-box-containing protein